MATQVIKRDGSKQPFDAEKIRRAISLACAEGGLTEERKAEVVEQVSASALSLAETKNEIAASELREKILSELDNVEPAAAQAWRKYDEARKGT
jgi:transcriptional regulator NrdR family protein